MKTKHPRPDSVNLLLVLGRHVQDVHTGELVAYPADPVAMKG